MTTPHRTLREAAQMALDALLIGYHRGTHDAIAALREALAAPEPEPLALESVHLTRDTRGMCVVRVNGRVAIRDNGDIIDHMATLEWFAAPPAAPASQWMPIETAPKDGRKIILTYRNANDKPRTVMAVWVTDEEAAESDEDDVGLEAGWYESIDNWDDYSQVAIHAGEPTHWMPLPAAPDDLRDTTEKVAPDGWVMVPREPTEKMIQAAAGAWEGSEGGLHNAFAAALRGGIAASPAAPVVPLTDEQILSMWKSSEFRGNDGGQADWFCEGIRAAEAHHGITGGKP